MNYKCLLLVFMLVPSSIPTNVAEKKEPAPKYILALPEGVLLNEILVPIIDWKAKTVADALKPVMGFFLTSKSCPRPER